MKMKKIILGLFVLISSVVVVNAQKGSWYLGGNVGLSSTQNKYQPSGGSTTNDGKTTTWSFSPEVGTFLTNNIQLGIGLTFEGSNNNSQGTVPTTNSTNYYGATLYGRYFFGKSSTFKPFIGINVEELPGTSKQTYSGTTLKSNVNIFAANFNAGFAFPLSNKVTAVGSFGLLGFENDVAKDANGNKSISNSFGLSAGTLGDRFNVGIYFTL